MADAGIAGGADTVAVVRFTADSPGDQGRLPKRMFRNPPLSLAQHLGLEPRRALYTATGGNTPQWLVNRTAEEIARGECEVALLAGAEYIASLLGAMKQGVDPAGAIAIRATIRRRSATSAPARASTSAATACIFR